VGTIAGKLFRLDPRTRAVEVLGAATHAAPGGDGSIYFTLGSELYRRAPGADQAALADRPTR